jgi:ribosomal protein L33
MRKVYRRACTKYTVWHVRSVQTGKHGVCRLVCTECTDQRAHFTHPSWRRVCTGSCTCTIWYVQRVQAIVYNVYRLVCTMCTGRCLQSLQTAMYRTQYVYVSEILMFQSQSPTEKQQASMSGTENRFDRRPIM